MKNLIIVGLTHVRECRIIEQVEGDSSERVSSNSLLLEFDAYKDYRVIVEANPFPEIFDLDSL